MQIKKFDSINIVPFIDIILVLLVIVLTTASFVAKGLIPIDLSQASSSTKVPQEKVLNITISKDTKIYFDEKLVSNKNILQTLKNYPSKKPIRINCDKDLKFDNFVFILDILKNNNYTNIAIVTKQK